MIRVSAPLRITLGGGGTDLPAFYEREGGFVCAMGIDQSIEVSVRSVSPGDGVRLHTAVGDEAVDDAAAVQHDLTREALAQHRITRGVEIHSRADVAPGTGLGSSGAYLVSLLHALALRDGERPTATELATRAGNIEIRILGRPIGTQDHFAAAFGGFSVHEIARDGRVTVRPLAITPAAARALVERMHVYDTGVRRAAADILSPQRTALAAAAPDAHGRMRLIKELGQRIVRELELGDLNGFGRSLHEHWELKRRLSAKITSHDWDSLYGAAREEHGVLGGKIIGAGGGGYLMLFSPNEPDALEQWMARQGYPRLRFTSRVHGSRVLSDVAQPA